MHDPRLTALEIAAGTPIGSEVGELPLPASPRERPLAALERALLPGLLRKPCVVSFSGGRDSSAILSVATRIARREGLDPPIPVTLRFPSVPDSDEAAWQEHVVRHLRLDEWVRLEYSDELDLVGPLATIGLRRHGLIWPPNSHFHRPVLEVAKGGAVLTGIDGDGVLGSWRWMRLLSVLTGRVSPRPRDALMLVCVMSPSRVRRAVEVTRDRTTLPWLRPGTMAELRRAIADDAITEPLAWNARVKWYARRRALRIAVRSLDLLAKDFDVLAVHGLADPGFLAALANAGGWSGCGDRTATMRMLFTGLLPDDVLNRGTKARMDGVFWTCHSREFLEAWNGEGVDHDLIDADALRREWSKPVPHAYTSTLLQSAWLAETTRGKSHDR